MYAGKCCLVFILTLLFCTPASLAQRKTKAQLQKEKQQNLAKIKEVEKILDETAAKKVNTIGELSALTQRIFEQENLITSIKQEISLLNTEMVENKDIIEALASDLEKLKKEYAAMLFGAQKANNSTTRLTFLFSSSTFDQLIMRLRYMEQYGKTRALQAEMITRVQAELTGKVNQIQAQREQKNALLRDELSENNQLEALKEKQNKLVKSLEKQEKKLKRDLDNTKQAIARLDKLIEDIIRDEIAREAAASRASNAVTLSASFEENKHKLPWPVTSGFISQKFGLQNHPVLKGIVLQNDGVNIQTKENEKVHCVFEGEVRSVAFVPAIGSTVLIRHGEYFTVYAGLRDVYVKVGQKVLLDQEIGSVVSNYEGVSELRFQIRKQTKALDPQAWLRNM